RSSSPSATPHITTLSLHDALPIFSHQYSVDAQSDRLMRMQVAEGTWEVIAKVPRLQGLAMVAHGQSLYRIGGFEARNQAGEEHEDRKSTRLNSSHVKVSYAVFCVK